MNPQIVERSWQEVREEQLKRQVRAVGQVALRIGDVLYMDHKFCIVDRLTDSAARCTPMCKSEKTFVPRFGDGKPVTVKKTEACFRISTYCEMEYLVVRLGPDWAQKNFSKVVPGFVGEPINKNLGKKETQQMNTGTDIGTEEVKTKTKRKPRGGLATIAAETFGDKVNGAAEASPKRKRASRAKTPKLGKGRKIRTKSKPATTEASNGAAAPHQDGVGRTKGRLGQLFGFSVVRVIVTVGKAGGTFENVVAGLKKNGISAAEATVKRNLYLGRKGELVGPELTAAQMADFGV